MRPALTDPPRRRRIVLTVLSASLLIVGFGMGIYSAIAEPVLVGERTLLGPASPGTVLEPLDFPLAVFAEVDLTVQLCGVFFHLLNPIEVEAFNATGALPPPSLHCELTATTVGGDITYLVVDNERGTPSNYTLSFRLYLLSQPNRLFVIPSLLLAVGGSAILLAILLRRSVGKLAREYLEYAEEKNKEKK